MGKGKKNKNYFHNVAAGYFFNCLYYKKTNNPLALWSVYRLCREENIAIPEWVYEYFDKCADKLLTDNNDKILMFKFAYLVCWLGIHRYKIIDITFGFGKGGSIQKLKCKICGIQKIKILT